MTALQSSIDSVRIAAAAADRLKATDIVAFDVTEPLAITDIMMIARATNERQVLAIAEEIEKDLYLSDGQRQARSREGLDEAQWVLLDFGDFVIHVMNTEAHDFYGLERLWKDCPAIELRLPDSAAQAGAGGADAAADPGNRADAKSDVSTDSGVVPGTDDVTDHIAGREPESNAAGRDMDKDAGGTPVSPEDVDSEDAGFDEAPSVGDPDAGARKES